MIMTMLAALAALAAAAGPGATARPPSLHLTAEPGWVIFDPNKDGYAYRYGPGMIANDDGSLDAWFASPGGPGEWDWIRYKRSPDGGRTWEPEQVVLRPTPKSLDNISVCDPGVVRFGGWTYVGVTAVDNEPGNRNQVFVARSKSPTGPFEKWNGKGWGGDPQPLVGFTTPPEAWGAGEPSFVVKGKTIYIYYTWWVTVNNNGPTCNQTRVATAPANDPNWPAHVTYRGIAWDREGGEDSADVKYVDARKCFLSVSTASRMGPAAHIVYRTSRDGIRWSAPAKLAENIKPWCHNCGISGTGEGHIDGKRPVLLGYAYSAEPKVNWGKWLTQLAPVTITSGPPRGSGSPGR